MNDVNGWLMIAWFIIGQLVWLAGREWWQRRHPALLAKVSVLNLNERDMLVVEVEQPIDEAHADRIRRELRALSGAAEVLVLSGAQLKVVRK